MGWSEDVHSNRVQSSLARARSEYKDRKRGYSITLGPDTELAPFMGLVGVLAGLAWWHRDGQHKFTLSSWRDLPGIRQLHALITNNTQTAARSVRGRQRLSVPRARPAPLQPGSQPEQQARAASHSAASSSATSRVTSPTATGQGLVSPSGGSSTAGKPKNKNKKKNKKKK